NRSEERRKELWDKTERYEREVVSVGNQLVEAEEQLTQCRSEAAHLNQEKEILERHLQEAQQSIQVGTWHINWSDRYEALAPFRGLSADSRSESKELRELVSRRPPAPPEPRPLFPLRPRPTLAEMYLAKVEAERKRSTPEEIKAEYDGQHAVRVLGLERR